MPVRRRLGLKVWEKIRHWTLVVRKYENAGNEGEDSKIKYLEKIEDARLGDGHGCWVISPIAKILRTKFRIALALQAFNLASSQPYQNSPYLTTYFGNTYLP